MGFPSESGIDKGLVEADDVGFAFFGLDDAGDLFGGSVRLSVGTDAHPIAGGAFKLDDIGAGIFALQTVAKILCRPFMMEDADLHAPAATGRGR